MKIRARGIQIGTLPTGKKNCITDVANVRVGHVTLDEPLEKGEYIATGVTAILPHLGNPFREKVAAASYIINGFGKTTGLIQLDELGVLESPIMLTNTFGVPAATEGALRWMLDLTPEIGDTTGTVNIVAGECNDSRLNSIRALSITPAHAERAIEMASTEPSDEGAVGAGKGMVCFGYKGGIGTSSRVLSSEVLTESYTIGCLVLSNFGKREEFAIDRYMKLVPMDQPDAPKPADGSIMIVLATDAPLDHRQLKRIAKRAGIGLARTGSHYSNGSGDIVIAFSTAHKFAHEQPAGFENVHLLRDSHPVMNELFQAAAEVTEEAILNSLSQAIETTGRNGLTVHPAPFS
ncbi:S58 family peptidase [Sporosarcina sp. BI001-red]|uniref:DmpA family aminopeptidase n=1 Tax=Sporosarcina sp. BI001-red TaxID=2282866 RepID=UPI000E2890B7|nr:P1 family peptidase [Sporosarcina sp. BI001-red]REB08196.1 S58 family peptidase [Sporosarcina sp. BI001-red]